ncbi:hypothetical protein K3G63_04465 [Hymenobacter sp. HSC-4F20]|uniref:hypothetical protein n=1 Tax=Hymenobacter sp. HSC-4F20 TaxID=2864135 RepID=UPI001C73808B|nr:hypothetical protein [Hymenobacter sp. HSC-4F20]MBX0289677.1 hypothetical protein [Hymenobacter sp. HSC-4F20]
MIKPEFLHPLIVPREYIENSTWDLPHLPLPNDEFILCWVEYSEAMVYLDRDGYNELNQSGLNWQQQALDNVRQSAYFHRYRKDNVVTGQPEWIAFLNDEDTISSSKVLLHYELERIFPSGYSVVIPDRACGIVVSNECSDETLAEVVQMVRNMYNGASVPMSQTFFSSSAFALPTEWTLPLEKETTTLILQLFQQAG